MPPRRAVLAAGLAVAAASSPSCRPVPGPATSAPSPPPRLVPAAVRECLRGRRVYFFGNSVARHWAYIVAQVLSTDATPTKQRPAGGFVAAAANRSAEKLECGRGGEGADAIYGDGRAHACHFSFGAPLNVSVSYGAYGTGPRHATRYHRVTRPHASTKQTSSS